jgi:uncharacterized protein YkwD
MAAHGQLAHNPNLADQVTARVSPSWTYIAENVGYGSSVDEVFDLFMGSADHRDHILTTQANLVGVGVVVSGGTVWVSVVFVGA